MNLPEYFYMLISIILDYKPLENIPPELSLLEGPHYPLIIADLGV